MAIHRRYFGRLVLGEEFEIIGKSALCVKSELG